MVMCICLYFISTTSLKKQKAAQGDILAEMNREKGRKKPKNENFELTKIIL